jgi:putative phosphoesterase
MPKARTPPAWRLRESNRQALTTRVGVVADTHSPEFLDRLPDRIFEALRGVDVILHCGDITGEATIAALERIAPVQAIRGDHDSGLSMLPLMRELTIEGKRIVMVHGNRNRWIEEPQTLLWTLSLGRVNANAGLPHSLLRRYRGADAIVFGHTHRPHSEVVDGTLLFNPGGVHQWNPSTTLRRLQQKPGWFEWSWLQVARHLQRYPVPSVGVLDVSRSAIVPNVIDL